MSAAPVIDFANAESLRATFESLAPHAHPHSLLSGRSCDEGWPGEPAWVDYLLALPEAELAACERAGLHHVAPDALPTGMPTSLRVLCDAVAAASAALGRRTGGCAGSCSTSCAWRQSAEKAEQVDALLGAVAARLCRPGRVRRVVDVGCGKGHLTAKLQAALGVPALGLDFDAALIGRARELYPSVTFEARDLVREGLACDDGDLVVGLHPCGALGEAIIRAGGRSSRGDPVHLPSSPLISPHLPHLPSSPLISPHLPSSPVIP